MILEQYDDEHTGQTTRTLARIVYTVTRKRKGLLFAFPRVIYHHAEQG